MFNTDWGIVNQAWFSSCLSVICHSFKQVEVASLAILSSFYSTLPLIALPMVRYVFSDRGWCVDSSVQFISHIKLDLQSQTVICLSMAGGLKKGESLEVGLF